MIDEKQEIGSSNWTTLDRHALVMSIWLAAGFVAFILLSRGYAASSDLMVVGGFVVVLLGFAGHVIVNVAWDTTFTPREVALGLVVYAIGLLWFLISVLFGVAMATALFFPFIMGFLVLPAAVVFYMVTHFGVRGAFNAFDVIRTFRP